MKNYFYYLLLIILSLFMTAGPEATMWGLATSFAAISMGFQVLGSQSRKLGQSTVARIGLSYWIGKAIFALILCLISFFPINTRYTQGYLLLGIFLCSPYGISAAKIEFAHLGRKSRQAILSMRFQDKFIVNLFLISIMVMIFTVVNPWMDGDAQIGHMRIAKEMQYFGKWTYNARDYVFAVMSNVPAFNFAAMNSVGGIEAVKVDLVIQFLAILALLSVGGWGDQE